MIVTIKQALILLCPLLLSIAACDGGRADLPGAGGDGGVADEPFRVLVFSRTAGFRHASIEAGIFTVQQLGAANGFEVDATEDHTLISEENLANYQVLMFLNTTLDVLEAEQEQAFENFVRSGGNFVGVHSAADTEHDWPFYGELVGAYFQSHPVANQPGSLRVEDESHPAVAHLDNPYPVALEEFYSFKSNPRGSVRVLLSIDEDSYTQEPNTSCDPSGPTFPQGYTGRMGDHPMSWCHDKFAGRVWYTALGHETYLYSTPDYQQHLLNGILTAARRVPASCEVNPKPDAVPDYIEPELIACEQQLVP